MRLVLPATILFGAILFAACGGDDNAKTSTPAATNAATATRAAGGGTPVPSSQAGAFTLNAILRDYEMVRNPGSGAAGAVFFHVSNTGPSQHEFVVAKTDLAKDQLPKKSDGTVDQSQLKIIGEIEPFDPGATETKTLTLDAGHYVFFCNILGQDGLAHYTQGMRADWTVQ